MTITLEYVTPELHSSCLVTELPAEAEEHTNSCTLISSSAWFQPTRKGLLLSTQLKMLILSCSSHQAVQAGGNLCIKSSL
jgi:hypothetical protein